MNNKMKHLKVDAKVVDGIQVIHAEGRIDHGNVLELDKFRKLIDDKNHLVILDISKVNYVSSSFIHFLLNFEDLVDKHKGKLTIVIQSDFVMNVLSLTGAKLRYKIFHSIDDAIAYLKKP